MKSRLKKITIFSLVFLFIFGTAITTTPKQQVKADDGYNGKIFRHWCKLRSSRSKRSKVLKRLEIGTPVTVYSTSGQWRKVSVDGKTGYVLKKYVYINTDAPTLEGTTYDKGQTVAQFAQRFVGNSYVWGGTDLNRGADCSGFTLSVYAHFGISLPHSATAQSYYGTEVSLSELEPGDLLFYGTDGDIGHVGIYTGGGMIVHASTEATGIKTSVYNYRTPIKAVRLLGQ